MIKVVLPILVLIISLVALALYISFLRKPETQWAKRVRSRLKELRGRLDLLLHPPANQRSAAERLADELFAKQKLDTSVQALSRYPKIGPKTVEWLADAGVRTLVDAEKHANAFLMFKKKIENVGEVREEAIAAAVKQCLIDERDRFDRGESEAGKEYRRRLEQLTQAEKEQMQAKARERAALESCIDRMADLEAAASRVSFLGSLSGRATGITAELMEREFPKVEIAPSAPAEPAAPPASPSASTAKSVNPALIHLQAACRFALLAAKADGRIAQAERAAIRNYLGDKLGSDPVLLRHLDPQLEEAEKNLPEEADAIRTIKDLTPPAEWLSLYHLAVEVIDSGGDRTAKESAFLTRLADAFGIDAAATELPVVEEAPAPLPAPAAPDARKVLEIPGHAELDAELVRRKYRMLTDQYDPAKARLLGPEFEAMAEAKRAAVKAAAEELLAGMNEPLEAPQAPAPTDLRHNPTLDDLFK